MFIPALRNYNVTFVWQMRSFHPHIVSPRLTILDFLHSHLNAQFILYNVHTVPCSMFPYTLCPVFSGIYFRSNCLHCAEYLFLRFVRQYYRPFSSHPKPDKWNLRHFSSGAYGTFLFARCSQYVSQWPFQRFRLPFGAQFPYALTAIEPCREHEGELYNSTYDFIGR